MAEHTPGPWSWFPDALPSGGIYVHDGRGGYIALVGYGLPFYEHSREQLVADARLIAAAPGLLAENEQTLGDLQGLANLLNAQQYDTALEIVHHAANRVSAIVARAKG